MSHSIEGEFIAPIITAGTPIILGAFAGIAALFRLWLSRYEKRQNARLDTIVHQVQNSHTINLRDDLDEKFADMVQRVDRISETQRRTEAKVDRIDRKTDALDDRLTRHIDGN